MEEVEMLANTRISSDISPARRTLTHFTDGVEGYPAAHRRCLSKYVADYTVGRPWEIGKSKRGEWLRRRCICHSVNA